MPYASCVVATGMSNSIYNHNWYVNCKGSSDISQLDSEYDAIVIGAGPAGSSAAYSIARAGAKILLVDKARFPRYKVCGCCLSFKSLRIIDSLGLSELLTASGGIPIRTLQVFVNGHKAMVSLPEGMSVSRAYLDCSMIVAARDQGVSFLDGAKAKIGHANNTYRYVLIEQSGLCRSLKTKVVIAADGLNGSSRSGPVKDHVTSDSKIGIGTILPAQPNLIQTGIIYMSCAKAGYVGLVRIENDLVNVAAAIDPVFIRTSGGPSYAAAAIIRSAGFPEVTDLKQAKWEGTVPLTHRVISPAATRLFVIGDAASYTEPFTGEGIAWALGAGAQVAEFAIKAISAWNQNLADDWSGFYRTSILKQQNISQYLSSLLRNPMLSEYAVIATSKFPGLAKPLVQYINTI